MVGGLISVAFLQGFLSSINVQRTLVCLDGGGGGSETDASLSWLVSSTADAEWRHQLGFLPAEEAVAERNRPSADETVMVFCRELFAWRGRSYPGWAFQRNFAWLVADGEGLDSDAEWSNQLRLDSRFFTYQYSADQSNDDRVVVNIREMYRVKRSPIITQDYGHWNHASGAMEVAEPALWERRTDLAGVELADTVLAWKPFMILDDPGGDFGMADGVMVEFLRSLQAVLNFTVRRYSPADGQWGFLEEVDNGTRKYMTGLVGELFRGEADLCTAGLYILKERQEYTDMLGVITDFSTLVLPRSLSNTGSQINMMAYLSIFSKGTWLCLLVSSVSVSLFFLLSGVVFFFHLSKQWPREKMKMKGLDESWWRKKVAFAFMSEGVEVAFLTLVQRGVDISVNLLSTRVAFLTANMVAFIMFAYYDADLTAKMTHRSPTVNLRSFQVCSFALLYQRSMPRKKIFLRQDVLDAEYRVRIIKGSAFVTWFKESPKGSAMHKVYEQMVEDPSMFVDNYAQAEEILKVRAGTVHVVQGVF